MSLYILYNYISDRYHKNWVEGSRREPSVAGSNKNYYVLHAPATPRSRMVEKNKKKEVN